MKMEQTECSETSAYKHQTPGNYPKESIQHTEHGKSLKSRMIHSVTKTFTPLHYTSHNYISLHNTTLVETSLLPI